MKAAGITIVETIIVVAVIAILGATTYPVGIGFLQRNELRNKTNELVAAHRTAQVNSMSGKENTTWGVNVDASQITMFKGLTYATRDAAFDQTNDIPSQIIITQDEVVFSLITGNPDSTATYVVSSDTDSNTVTVNEVGIVNVN